MDEQLWVVTAAGGAVALTLLVACGVLWRSTRRLAARVAQLEGAASVRQAEPAPVAAAEPDSGPPAPPAAPAETSYVITGIDRTEQPPTATIDGRLFADIVARESVIKAAGLAYGVRRALDPQTRNRIRFEMRRELRRARRQRRADLRTALRDFRARERADLDGDAA